MSRLSNWQRYNQGRSIGSRGSEGGTIVRDEEHKLGARITIKEAHEYISVSCSITGKMDHTRFFTDMSLAEREYAIMKRELAKVVQTVSTSRSADIKVWEAISEFVMRFQ